MNTHYTPERDCQIELGSRDTDDSNEAPPHKKDRLLADTAVLLVRQCWEGWRSLQSQALSAVTHPICTSPTPCRELNTAQTLYSTARAI